MPKKGNKVNEERCRGGEGRWEGERGEGKSNK